MWSFQKLKLATWDEILSKNETEEKVSAIIEKIREKEPKALGIPA